ncbi:MAG: efflux RND transporter periplasmic adaptor subunit [Opitutus sp.]
MPPTVEEPIRTEEAFVAPAVSERQDSRIRWKRHVGWIFVMIAITAALAVRLWPSANLANGNKSVGRERAPQAVRTVLVQPEVLRDEVIGTGTVRASESVDLHTENSGKVMKVFFAEGAAVRKGDPLLQIDDAELQAQLARAEQRHKLAAVREARLRSLKEQGFSNLQDFDTAVSELAVQATEIDLIKTQLAKLLIGAPFDGTIGLRFVSEGAYVTSATRIARLQAVDEIKIDFTLPEKYGAGVRPGQSVRFSVVGVDGTSPAEVYAIEPQIDEATRTLLVRARAANSDGRFRPGAFARVTWSVGEIKDALLVPAVALVPESAEPKLFVIENGHATLRSVRLGLRHGARVQIAEGLRAGEVVVVAGVQQLRAGMEVTDELEPASAATKTQKRKAP